MDYFTRKSLSKYLLTYDRFQWTRCQHFCKWHVAKICGQHRATIQNYNVTWTSLWTNLKAKSTLTWWLLRPVAGALHDNNLQLHLAFDTAGEWNQSLFSSKAICSSFFSHAQEERDVDLHTATSLHESPSSASPDSMCGV